MASTKTSTKTTTSAKTRGTSGGPKASTSRATSRASVYPRRGRPKAPVHPGKSWLALMRAAGLSQAATAERMGVAAMTLSRLVNGHGIPTANITVAFARAVGADTEAVWSDVCTYELAVALQAAKAARAAK